MSLNNSRASYHDCYELFDAALEDPRGIRIKVNDTSAAQYLRMRLHHARVIDRRENKVTYADTAHPLHNKSVYDELVVRIEEGEPALVYLDKMKVDVLGIEPIPEDHPVEPMRLTHGAEPEPEPEAEFVIVEPPKQIESPERLKRRV